MWSRIRSRLPKAKVLELVLEDVPRQILEQFPEQALQHLWQSGKYADALLC